MGKWAEDEEKFSKEGGSCLNICLHSVGVGITVRDVHEIPLA